MKVAFYSCARDAATGEVVNPVELRFTPGEWDAFVTEMKRAWPEGKQKPDQALALAALVNAITRGMGGQVNLTRELTIPIEKIDTEDFHQLTARGIAKRANGG